MRLKKMLLLSLSAIALAIGITNIQKTNEVQASKKYFIQNAKIGDSDCYWSITNDYVLEITGTGDPGLDIKKYEDIPWKLKNNNEYYMDNIHIKSIYISTTVTPKNMNYWFYDLEEVTECSALPDGVESCYYTFGLCDNLKVAPKVPNSVTNASHMFSGCKSLENSPDLPDSIIIASSMFSGCESLTAAPKLSNNITNCSHMFANCINIEKAPDIPSSAEVCSEMFYGCAISEAPELPNNIKDAKYMFANCENLVLAPKLPDGIEDCEAMFLGCISLVKPPTLPENVKNIDKMFKSCIKLEYSPIIPAGIKSTAYLLSGCTNLKELPVIPNGVIDTSGMYSNCNIDTMPIIPDGVEKAQEMFKGCTKLVNITKLPDSIQDCSGMFSGCSSLATTPNIPNSAIDCSYMFEGCSNLTTAPTIPNGVTATEFMFDFCTKLNKAPEIPNKVTNTRFMFRGCESLTQAPKIPEGVTNCYNMFRLCSNIIETPRLPDSIKDCSYMFSGCIKLKSVPNIPNSTETCAGMFQLCKELTQVPNLGNTIIDCEEMFSNCVNLKQAPVIPNSVENCKNMFAVCTALKQAPVIPDTVKDCSGMFSGCSSLVSAPKIPSNTSTCENMFKGCTSLKVAPVIYLSNIKYNNMFDDCYNLKSVIIDMDSFNYTYPYKEEALENTNKNNNIVNVYYTANSSEEVAKKFVSNVENVNICGEYKLEVVEQPKDVEVLPNTEIKFVYDITNAYGNYKWYLADDENSAGELIDNNNYSSYIIEKEDVTLDLHKKFVYCEVEDILGNKLTSDRALIQVVELPTVPAISADIKPNGWANGDLAISLLGSNISGDTSEVAYKYSLDNGATWVDYIEPLKWNTNSNNITIIAKAYNINHPDFFTDKTELKFKYDGTLPTISSSYQSEELNIKINASDALSGILGYGVSKSAEEYPAKWSESDIVPVDDYGVYYVWVKDNAGNIRRYNNTIEVLRGYLYKEVEVNGVNTVYDGNKHTGSVICDGATIKYSTSIASTYNLTQPPSYKNAGTYTVYFQVSKDGYKQFDSSFDIVINKAQGTATLSIADVVLGTKLNPIVTTSNNATYRLYYKKKGEDDTTYKTTEPRAAGTYIGKVVVNETNNHYKVEAYTEFNVLESKLEKPSVLPVSTLKVPYDKKKVKDISYELPTNWVWEDGAEETELIAGESVIVTAKYIGSDAYRYEITTHEIAITRTACNHMETTLINSKDASCFELGYTGDTICIKCESVIIKGKEKPKQSHSWDNGIVTLEPNENTNGTKLFTCQTEGCNETKEIVVYYIACKHTDTISQNSINPTCENKGYTGDSYCMACNTLVDTGNEIDSLGHSWGSSEIIVEPTYTNDGILRYYCINANCTKTKDEIIPTLICNHESTTLNNFVDSTCTSKGYTGDLYCVECSSIINKGQETKSLEHDWNEGTIIEQPTYKSNGKIQYTCNRANCNEKLESSLPALICKHSNIQIRELVESTCKNEGYTGDKYCLDCDTLVSKGAVKAKLEHTWGTNNKCIKCGLDNSSVNTPNEGNPVPNTPQTPSNPNTPNTQDKNNKEENKQDINQDKQEKENEKTKEEISKAKKNKAKISKVVNKKGKKLEIKIKKQKGYKYEIQVSTSKKFKKSTKKYTTAKTTYTIKKLKKGKTYYIRIRTYKIVNGNAVYGKWSSTKKVTIKK